MAQVTVTIVYDDENDVRRTAVQPAQDWDGSFEWVTGVPVPNVVMQYLGGPVAPTSLSVLPAQRVKKLTWTVQP